MSHFASLIRFSLTFPGVRRFWNSFIATNSAVYGFFWRDVIDSRRRSGLAIPPLSEWTELVAKKFRVSYSRDCM